MQSYIQDTIIPPGLVSRDLTTIPAQEEKRPGPAFGTNVGAGLAVGSALRALPTPPILKCPSKLEIRQILQYKPISEELRNGYVNWLIVVYLLSLNKSYAHFRKLDRLDLKLINIPCDSSAV